MYLVTDYIMYCMYRMRYIGCNDGDIMLVGGDSNAVGTVEVCYRNTWGLISDQNWDDDDAKVVCRQLGYNAEGTVEPHT